MRICVMHTLLEQLLLHSSTVSHVMFSQDANFEWKGQQTFESDGVDDFKTHPH